MTGYVRRASTTRNATTCSPGSRLICVIEWFMSLAWAMSPYRFGERIRRDI